MIALTGGSYFGQYGVGGSVILTPPVTARRLQTTDASQRRDATGPSQQRVTVDSPQRRDAIGD